VLRSVKLLFLERRVKTMPSTAKNMGVARVLAFGIENSASIKTTINEIKENPKQRINDIRFAVVICGVAMLRFQKWA